MQLTRAADYAVRVMIHLAGLPPGARVSRSELSAIAECPEQFLCKVLQNLTRAGLVISHRGNTGGFELEELHRTASDRTELRDWKRRRTPWLKQILFYLGMALIPVFVFGFLFLIARRH